MKLLDLVDELGLSPKRVSSTEGGEYHSPCPLCGGKDRFVIWPQNERYWCRQCGKKGDPIQFCRDFMGMGYKSACEKVGAQVAFNGRSHRLIKKFSFSPVEAIYPPAMWRLNADAMVTHSHGCLMTNRQALQLLYDRGFPLEIIRIFRLGWNPQNSYLSRSAWGLPQFFNEAGVEKSLWIPKGIVIPTITDQKIIKLKIRRAEEGDFAKYVEVVGSMKCFSFFGSLDSEIVILVESELDAMLIQQFASDLCCCVATGGAGKRPDLRADRILRKAKLILFAMDFDQAGQKAYYFWRTNYPAIYAWPVPVQKSPGDALQHGVDLRAWIISGVALAKK